MKKLVFPHIADPEVSIVVVTYGAEKWVRRCLRAIVDSTEPRYELIVVDNASPNGFAERLSAELENARVFSNPVNRGFGPANNQAANVARGPLLAFLNSDVLVQEGWLSPLTERLSRAPRAGAVAPRVLNLDGTLQEAGALLFANGYTQFYGFGDDPRSPQYLFAREVDYASAACLLVRRRAFFEVGGFDAAYAPAYYEDVDLCLSLREKGYRILYEPRALVTHARGASSSPTLAVRLWHRNHPIFFARWKERLKGRPAYTPPDGNPRLRIAARDAPATAKILLVAESGEDWLPVAVELARLAPDSHRALVSTGSPPAGTRDRLAALGWELCEAGTIGHRPFHYDVVVFPGSRSRELFEEVLAATQPQAVRISAGKQRDLAAALGEAGVPPPSVEAPISAVG